MLKDDFDVDEFINFMNVYRHMLALNAIKKIQENSQKKQPDASIPEDTIESIRKIARDVSYVKRRPPICKNCWFYRDYGYEDPRRFMLVVRTKVELLPFLFLKPESKYVIDKDWFYPDYENRIIIACPTVECGISIDVEKADLTLERQAS
jgi:hypothetical protein